MSDTQTLNGYARSANRSQRAIAVDNFLRKSLRVNDPHDPGQIANALRQRYPEEADRERREREGLPYANIRDPRPALQNSGSASNIEVDTARGDFERDIQALTTQSQLKDISIEMTGWGRAIRKSASDGLAAARLSLDSNNHDSAFAARKTLSDYGRLSRYLGVLSDGNGGYFRRLAQSCDVLGALILVGIGDGLAAGGVTRSAALVRVTAGELQTRRSAVISALRILNGSLESSYAQDDYPRGIVGYQALIRALESSGQADLRALLEENALGAAMDQLTDLTHGANVANLRELATTSALLVHRFNRLILFAQATQRPVKSTKPGAVESPPLLVFAAALQLFVDAFSNSGGNRLLFLARPPILAYGLYDNASSVPVDYLVRLSGARTRLAQSIDCLACCGCSDPQTRTIVLFDFVLSFADRAVDLLAMGTDIAGKGATERRAAAAGILAYFALKFTTSTLHNIQMGPPGVDVASSAAEIVRVTLLPFAKNKDVENKIILDAETAKLIVRELVTAHDAEKGSEALIQRLAPGCGSSALFNHPYKPKTKGAESADLSIVRLFLRSVLLTLGYKKPFDAPPIIDLPHTTAAGTGMGVSNRPYLEHNFGG